jgi:hypothetical protein
VQNVVERVIDEVVLVPLVRLDDPLPHRLELVHRPAVDLDQLGKRYRVHGGSNPSRFPSRYRSVLRIFRYVSAFPVEDLVRQAHVLEEVDHRDPEAQDLRPASLDDLVRRDDVPERLRHLPALAVEREAVRDHAPVRRAPAVADGDEQRRVEPPAVLIVPSR